MASPRPQNKEVAELVFEQGLTDSEGLSYITFGGVSAGQKALLAESHRESPCCLP